MADFKMLAFFLKWNWPCHKACHNILFELWWNITVRLLTFMWKGKCFKATASMMPAWKCGLMYIMEIQ